MNQLQPKQWLWISIGGAVLLFLLILAIALPALQNRAINLEENINTSLSNRSKEDKRRADLFNNMADAVQSYNKFEQKTLTDVIAARQQANGGNVEQASLMLAAVVEQYPELKSQENYKTLMLEFSVTENRIAQYREQYNNDVREYKRMTRNFWNSKWLSFMGYEVKDYQYIDYEVKENEHRNLFDE